MPGREYVLHLAALGLKAYSTAPVKPKRARIRLKKYFTPHGRKGILKSGIFEIMFHLVKL
jgi:hypothetical protein